VVLEVAQEALAEVDWEVAHEGLAVEGLVAGVEGLVVHLEVEGEDLEVAVALGVPEACWRMW
jgi:hypothetical protein